MHNSACGAWYGFDWSAGCNPPSLKHPDIRMSQWIAGMPTARRWDPYMISVESWPDSAVKLWTLAQRFQKFVLVGVVGLAVNQFGLMALHSIVGLSVPVASPFAIFASMVVTFLLNEIWTWQDRGRGRVIHRAMSYVPINIGGLVINWGILYYLHEHFGMHYLVANLFGAGVAAIWNFALNNAITWRE